MSAWKVVAHGVQELNPDHFALVMATGIVSIVCGLHGLTIIARALLGFNLLAFGILAVLTVGRAGWFLTRLLADLQSHVVAPRFLTLVAGTCALGSQLVTLEGESSLTFLLWVIGELLWWVFMYGILLGLIVHDPKPDLATGLDGSWMLAVVATQSVALLGAQETARFPAGRQGVLLFSLALYLIGCLLYIVIVSLIFQRLLFFPVAPREITPAYWIVMGATAITTLTGATLMSADPRWVALGKLLPLLTGLSLLFWAVGTWWIPLLLLLEAWRHAYRGVALRYESGWWGAVFPLGMYATASFALGEALQLPVLFSFSQVFMYLGLAGWMLTCIGLLHRLWSDLALPAVGRAYFS